jgi:hypothetical protein
VHNDNRPGGITRRALLARGAATGLVLSVMPTWALRNPQALKEENLGLLEKEFLAPPDTAKPWTYWWWLDGASSKEGITKDLEAMKAQGISGVLLFDAGIGGPLAPRGNQFMSDLWRENFRHAVRESARLEIEMGVNLCSGWDAGGPWVSREDAIKALVLTETVAEGRRLWDATLPQPKLKEVYGVMGATKRPDDQDWYRDIAVLACRVDADGLWNAHEAVDLTDKFREGKLKWVVPEGTWTILRFGYTLAAERISAPSAAVEPSWEIDPLSSAAMDHHFAATGTKLIEDAGLLAGRTLKYTHIDSWEIGSPSWTASFIENFRARRGYDPIPYLPALAGKTVTNKEVTERFQWDYRRTLADLVAENYYGRLSKLSHEHGLGTHPESGGPFYTHDINGLECEGTNDIPMAEFWASRFPHPFPSGFEEGVSSSFFRSFESDFPPCNYGSVRQAATAAHIYGKPVCQAEAYTSFNDDWTEYPFFLKVYGDRAFCAGMTRHVLCFYVHQPDLNAKPGYQWAHTGTHFDRNITWWEKSHAWLIYLARCQYMLRQGKFVADILYFSGEAIPNFVLIDRKPLSGYDFDTINAQVLLTRATVKAGRIVLPDGMSYRYLVIPENVGLSMTSAVVTKFRELVEGGATLIGSRPRHAPGLTDYPRCDEQVKQQADALWGTDTAASGMRSVGNGRVIWGKTLEEVINADQLPPDIELSGLPSDVELDWIHRRSASEDIYFIANLSDRQVNLEITFRIERKVPELWDAITGSMRRLEEFREENGRTIVPMQLEQRQSFFVVFRRASHGAQSATGKRNFTKTTDLVTLNGPWEVSFDPTWGGPKTVTFEQLEDWSKRSEDGIRYYSGTAIYKKTFDLPHEIREPLYLDLGEVKNLAQVRVNGKDLGVVWTAPWRVAIGDVAREKGNELEIEVVNLWPNRLIGDGKLPNEKRLTVTNVRTYDPVLPKDFEDSECPVCEDRKRTGKAPELLPSGLLGPVVLQCRKLAATQREFVVKQLITDREDHDVRQS